MGLILTQNVTKCRLATKAGEAMFFDEIVDFSAYAGGTKLIAFKDSGGKYAYAYGYTQGAGEALNGNLITGWVNSSNYPVDTLNTAGVDIVNYVKITGTQGRISTTAIASQSGRLYKFYIPRVGTLGTGYGISMSSTSPIVSGEITAVGGNYITAISTATRYFSMFNNGPADWAASETWFKEVTNVPSTGLLLVSAYGGATRNMLSTETGFLPNSITTVYVYNVVAPSTPSPADGSTVAYTTSKALQVTNADSGICDIKFYTGAGAQIGATQLGVAAGATATVTATDLSSGLQSWYATATNSVGTVQSATWSYMISPPLVALFSSNNNVIFD